ncbi:glutathionylspermidine synthase family protein [Tissierella sp. Yu-01]|uniref:glutathionylspermidine synthase family protein n=1 Tax=Tissierella sp. Yu-01 TaxID=3035694 RepID=UPI00240DE3D5|nr:glutathionylspermidine synthase family protein [Tissierella sp. Yu-01]WFA08203.1 glutathionylspermidine synthase family protein [Tissierella sp. Yu-01]
MDTLEINKEYIDLVFSKPNEYADDYQLTVEKVANSSAIYKGKPVPFLYHPMFYTEEDIQNFKKISDMIISITNKVTDRYVKDEEFRKKFGFPKFIEELIQIENGYDINVPIGRFDIFYKDYENFMFCEINTDGSSAMNEDNAIGRILLEAKALRDFGEIYMLDYFELIDLWVEDSLDIFSKYDPSNSKPNVAIVDFVESGTSAEFEEFKKAYIKKGYNCIIADPRNLEYRDGKLYLDDYRIDLVYRRIVTFELIEKIDEIPDFIEAYKNRAFCCIGSIKSQVVHNKIIFKILHDEDTLEYLSEEEQEFVKNHFPVTGIFGGNEEVFNLVLNHKDKYIMKPMDLNASQGVFVGRDLTQDEWEKRLEEAWDNEYLYQEFFDPFVREHVVFNDGKPIVDTFKSVVGLFIYKEKFAGIYTRVGKNNVISGITDYHTLPNILVRR